MSTLVSKPLTTPCFFRADGVKCVDGYLRYSMPCSREVQPGVWQDVEAPHVAVEGEPVSCPACEGRGRLLTLDGREVLMLLQTFGRPFLRDLVDELFEEREHH